ncbi:MAG TPA: hypothetical protein VFB71_08885 [Ramlibacter sp.]|nr:hypothetical protein [Ramlibacter sp.]
MNSTLLRSVLCIVAALLLASCGGGGGGGGDAPPATSATQSVISTGNAKAVAADALDASFGSESVRTAAALLLASTTSADGSTSCALGGTLGVTSTIAAADKSLKANDSITLTASNCQAQNGGQTFSVNGSVTMIVASGSYVPNQAPPFRIVMRMSFSNFAVSGGGVTETANGDVTMDLNSINSTDEDLTVSGSALSLAHNKSGVTRSRILRNYSQSLQTRGDTITETVLATVESVNSKIGAGTFTYQITTPTPITVTRSTGAVTAGVVRVTSGAVVLQVRVTSTDVFAIDLDLNGDGAIDAALSANKAELESLL